MVHDERLAVVSNRGRSVMDHDTKLSGTQEFNDMSRINGTFIVDEGWIHDIPDNKSLDLFMKTCI